MLKKSRGRIFWINPSISISNLVSFLPEALKIGFVKHPDAANSKQDGNLKDGSVLFKEDTGKWQ